MKQKFTTRKSLIMILAALISLVMAFSASGVFASAATMAGYYDAKPYHYNEEAEGRFASDYATLSDAHMGARKLNEEIMGESITMLKNDDTLPFGNDIKNISVFGKHSVDFAHIVRANPRQTMDTKTASLEESLTQAGFNLNPHLAPFYRSGFPYEQFSFTHPENSEPTVITSPEYRNSVLQPPVSAFPYAVTNSLRLYNDAALVVLGNRGAQANVYARNYAAAQSTAGTAASATAMAAFSNANDYYNHFFMLTQSEKDLINYVGDRFDNVVVLINSSEVWDIPFLKEHPNVGSILYMDAPGADGILALGKILNGQVNPSGRLINMFVSDQSNNPQWANLGDGMHILDGAGGKTGKTRGAINYYSNPEFEKQEAANRQNSFQNYNEGIYIGAKYYETRGWEMGGKSGTPNPTDADPYSDGDWTWYDDNVVYPLGHGLSYSKFKWELESASPASGEVLDMGDKITVRVRVTNTGGVPGKDVVELYYTPPYFEGGVEKAFVNLAGFAKTKILNPGQSQVVTITLMAQNMASYDWNNLSGMGKNSHNTWGAYVLEAGSYQVRLMRNANVRTQELVIDYTVDSTSAGFKAATTNSAGSLTMPGGIMYAADVDTGNDVENRFSVNDPVTGAAIRITDGLKLDAATKHQYGVFNSYSDSMTVFTRGDFDQATPASFPKPVTDLQRLASQEIVDELLTAFSPDDPVGGDVSTQPWMKDFIRENPTGEVPANWTQAADTSATPSIMFKDMIGVGYDDPLWDQFLNQWQWAELVNAATVNSGSYGSGSNERFGKPKGSAPDGAHGLSGSAGDNYGGDVVQGRGSVHPAPGAITMTWNQDLMYRNGRQMGAESRLAGNNNLYTVTFDVRRHSFDTRVWEGCSEDPFLIGTRGMYYVRGAQDMGTMVQIKHFINYNGGPMMNVSIGYRNMTEQAFREIYAEAFRKATVYNKERNYGGGALAVMVAVAGLGVTPNTQNYALLTGLLRKEWGFSGWVTQDYNRPAASPTNITINLHKTLRAGSDQFMGSRPNVNALPAWDATLRGGSGNVKNIAAEALAYGDPTAARPIQFYGIANAESHASYWFWRSAAKRILFAELLSHVFSSSGYLYKDAFEAFTGIQNISLTQGEAPAANTSVALTSAQVAELLPEKSVVTYRLAQGESLPDGLEFTPWGEIRRETSDPTHPDNGTVANQANNAKGAWLRESSTNPYNVLVEMLIDNQVRARKHVVINTTSAFVLGDGFTGGQNINANDVSSAVNMSQPYTGSNLIVGKPFSGQIQGAARTQFHVAVADPTWQNPEGTSGRTTTFTLVGGSLPAGLTLNLDGSITGTPLSAGQSNFTIQAHRRIHGAGREILSVGNTMFTIHASMVVGSDIAVVNDAITAAMNANAKGFLTEETATTLINSLTTDYVTAAQVTAAINTALDANAKGFLTNETATTLINSLVDAKGFQTAAQVTAAIDAALTANAKGFLTEATATTLINSIVNGKGFQTAAEVNALIAVANDALELGLSKAQVDALIDAAIEAAEVPVLKDGTLWIGGEDTGIKAGTGGCGSTIAAGSIAAFGLLAVAFAVIIFKRKSKQK